MIIIKKLIIVMMIIMIIGDTSVLGMGRTFDVADLKKISKV